jgi:hypothetical protein
VFSVDLSGRAPDVLDALVGGAAERRLPMLFDGVRPLGEVVRLGGLPEQDSLELVFVLHAFALLRPAVARPAVERDRFAVHDRDIERERVMARHSLALEGTTSTCWACPRGPRPRRSSAPTSWCSGPQPARLGPELLRSLARAGDHPEVTEEALRVLGSDSLRSRYEAHLPRETTRSGLTMERLRVVFFGSPEFAVPSLAAVAAAARGGGGGHPARSPGRPRQAADRARRQGAGRQAGLAVKQPTT